VTDAGVSASQRPRCSQAGPAATTVGASWSTSVSSAPPTCVTPPALGATGPHAGCPATSQGSVNIHCVLALLSRSGSLRVTVARSMSSPRSIRSSGAIGAAPSKSPKRSPCRSRTRAVTRSKIARLVVSVPGARYPKRPDASAG